VAEGIVDVLELVEVGEHAGSPGPERTVADILSRKKKTKLT